MVFSHGNSFRMVEVKSQRSNDEDFRRGIYQCVKYREIKKAEYAPYTIDVQGSSKNNCNKSAEKF